MNYNISVIIPVLHEAHIINYTITHLYNQKFTGNFEILVVDGTLEGDTLKAVSCEKVKKIISEKGRGIQMNTGAFHAGCDILLFLHADTRLPPDGLFQIVQAFKEKNIIGGAFDLGIDSKKKIFRIIEKTASIRSRITMIPYGDQALFIQKKFFHKIKGFKNIPIMEDVDLMRRIKKAGKQISIIPSKVYTSPRRWEFQGVFYGTLRNWLLIAFYLKGTAPEKLAKFYK